MMLLGKKIVGWVAGLACLSLSAAVQAGFIDFNYEATVSAVGADTLGIDGETIGFTLTFDDTDTWQDVGGNLYFPTVSATASITGGHTVALNTAAPATGYFIGNTMVSAYGDGDFLDFIIDSVLTQSLVTSPDPITQPTAITPSAGDNLLVGHLADGGFLYSGFDSSNGFNVDYEFLNQSILITTRGGVPVPSMLAVFGIGLVGLGFARRYRVA